MTRPLYLHIGLQKTGTSYLQGLFLGSVDALCEALRHSATLKALALWRCGLSASSVASLARALRQSGALETLDLYGNQLTELPKRVRSSQPRRRQT